MYKTLKLPRLSFLILLLGILILSITPALAQDTQEEICYSDATFTLWAGQDIDTGSVTLSFDGEILSVTYNTSGDWLLNTVHAAAATNLEELTGNNGNRLSPGQLAALNTETAVGGSAEGAGATTATVALTLTQTMLDGIGTDGFQLYVVAHAEVYTVDENGDVVETETGYGGDNGGGDSNNWWYYMLYTFETEPCDEEPPTGDGAGCTPGFWKNNTFWDDDGIVPLLSDDISVLFSINLPVSMSVDYFLNYGGPDMASKLLRAAAAAYLNTIYHDGYPMSTGEVVDAVNAALASGDFDTLGALKDELDGYNNLGCPLNAKGELDEDSGDDSSDNGDSGDSGDTGNEGGEQEEAKVALCHIPGGDLEKAFIIEVAESAVDAHLAHGDVLGYECPAPSDNAPGNSGDAGNKDNNGDNGNNGNNGDNGNNGNNGDNGNNGKANGKDK